MLAGCVDMDGNAHVWGYGSYWQLGTGKTQDAGQPQQVHSAFVACVKASDAPCCS